VAVEPGSKAAEPFGYTRIHSDGTGESHFEDTRFTFSLTEFSPDLPPVFASAAQSTGNMVVLSAPAGGVADWHPVPGKQVNVILSGMVEIEVSDGEVRRFGPGSYILGEDTLGKGHITRVVGSIDAYFLAISLSNDREA